MTRFTKQQVEDANRTDLAAYLRMQGETLKRSGVEHRWVYRDAMGEHDSITIRGSEWFDHKNQIGGGAVSFVQRHYNLSFRNAVATLLGQSGLEMTAPMVDRKEKTPERPPFTVPQRAHNMHRLYAYLCKTRSIAPPVVTHFVKAGTLFEDAKHHSAVFIATDEKGKPQGAARKSTHSQSHFRQTMAGSDTRYAFHHKGKSGKVYVFEAAVDMLSFISLHQQDWQRHSYLALDGMSPKALLHFLQTHRDVGEICLCLDNDTAGQQATQRITVQLHEQGYEDVSVLRPQLKDWNEDISHVYNSPEIEMTMT